MDEYLQDTWKIFDDVEDEAHALSKIFLKYLFVDKHKHKYYITL